MQDTSHVRELVQGFRENHKALKDENTSEAVIRGEYIDRFWILLGWDVHNRKHRSLAEKDVVVEANIGTIEGQHIRQRRPDYLFRIDGFPRFIVEAKKCTVDIATDKEAIFQAKTYAWSAQIPFAILTNFERFRLFDTTVKPHYHAPEGEVIADFDLKFEDYEQQWDVLEQTFGREAAAAGSLEKLLAKIKHVRAGRRIRGIDRMLIDLRGSEPVDKAFLAHLEDFRLRIARELYRGNNKAFPEASTKHGAARLAEAAQRIVDRLVFIRVCEDRGITSYGELREAVNTARDNRRELYPELVRLFRRFDERYNGYLFKAHFSEDLTVPADSLVDFIRSLYLPDGPYRFDAIGDDILGIIYERFLASAITVTRGIVDAEPKPEVRHAGGVYYTPRFIVDTIVRRVVGPKIEGKGPAEILNVTILDPACGSGSFLIAALQYLYTHCLKCFEKDPQSALVETIVKRRRVKKKLGFQDAEGNWHLMPEFRGQILQSCIYGVDIDGQAVEVTIMSLYLKMLEGKLPEHWQRDMLEARLLPPLDNNIRCGNSLISQTDFDTYWENKFKNLFGGDEDVRFRINAFDWTSQTRGFGRIFQERKGFDCIIGNPPYIRVQELKKWEPEECEFYKANYKAAAKGNYDIYVVFIEKALNLLAADGLLGFICPNKFLTKDYASALRKLISEHRNLREVISFGANQVFRGATTYTCILALQRSRNESKVRAVNIQKIDDAVSTCAHVARSDSPLPGRAEVFFVGHPKNDLPWSLSESALVAMLESLPRLHEVAQVFVGVQTDADDVYYLTPIKRNRKAHTMRVFCRCSEKEYDVEEEILLDLLQGTNVSSYEIRGRIAKVIFPFKADAKHRFVPITARELRQRYPLAIEFFADKTIKERLEGRAKGKLRGCGEFWDFVYRKNLAKQSLAKICVPRLAERVSAALDERGSYCLDNVDVCGVIPTDEDVDIGYLLGLLNSKLLDRYMKETIRDNFRGGYLSLNKQFLGLLPIKIPRDDGEKEASRGIAARGIQIIAVKKRLATPGLSDREREQLEREIEGHERRIDELVCELYGVKEIPE